VSCLLWPLLSATPTPAAPAPGPGDALSVAGCPPPRPAVGVAAAPGAAGQLQVTVTAHPSPSAPSNQLRRLEFGAAAGALVDAGGQTGLPGNFTITLPAGTQATTFTVRQAVVGQPASVPLTVVDDCGEWPTFIGGGPQAFSQPAGTTSGAISTATPTPGRPGPGSVALTTTLTPSATATATVTTTPNPCTPRPPVRLSTARRSGGGTDVTVSAGTGAQLQALQFGAATGATVQAGGQTGPGGFTVTLPPGTTQTSFFFSGTAAGQPATVPLTVVDTCGNWPTLVGDGHPTPVPTATPTLIAAQAQMATAYQLNPAHDGGMQLPSLQPPLRLRWRANLGQIVSYPLIARDKVFVTVSNGAGSIGSPSNAKLWALNTGTGAPAWGPFDLFGPLGSAHATYDAGRVFAISDGGVLRAVDADTGDSLWSSAISPYAFANGPPSALQGSIYVTDQAGQTTVSELTGEVLWRIATGYPSLGAAVGDDGGLYTSPGCPIADRQDRTTGAFQWTTPDCGGVRTVPVYSNHLLFVRRDSGNNNVFNANNGNVVGQFSATQPPALANGRGFFLNGSVLQSRDPLTDAVAWSFAGDGTLAIPPIVVNNYVYVGGTSGMLYALDAASGQPIWTTNVGESIGTPPGSVATPMLQALAAGEGLLIVPAGGSLVAFETSPSP
jgi:outer membrane protein assembly factor BamB